MSESTPAITITVSKNGPYLVRGGAPLSMQTIIPNEEGGSWEWAQGRAFETGATYALCRCGNSSNKPFCDGTHAKVGFDGTETAERRPFTEQAESIQGPDLDLADAQNLCAFARFCDNRGGIWDNVERGGGAHAREVAVHEGTHCPSGRLVLRDRATGETIEPHFEPSIALVEDPAERCSGPLWVRGGIAIASADGTPYETRNRVTLCRCGQSSNKPFCDGSHASAQFKDGL